MDTDTLEFDSPELCRRIAKLTGSMMDFWADGGWAQAEAANLLDRSMLNWQSSLAESLSHWNPFVQLVQQRRNAVHAFQHREIGSFAEWTEALRLHLSFVRDVGGHLPVPEECFKGYHEI